MLWLLWSRARRYVRVERVRLGLRQDSTLKVVKVSSACFLSTTHIRRLMQRTLTCSAGLVSWNEPTCITLSIQRRASALLYAPSTSRSAFFLKQRHSLQLRSPSPCSPTSTSGRMRRHAHSSPPRNAVRSPLRLTLPHSRYAITYHATRCTCTCSRCARRQCS